MTRPGKPGPARRAEKVRREPRLTLLDHTPIELKDPAGTASVKLALTVPLENSVRMDDITVRAQAHASLVRLTGEDLGSPDAPGAVEAWRRRYP